MKIVSNRTVLTCFTVFAALILCTSCLPDAADPPSQLFVGVQLNDIDSILTAGEDSLVVNRVRLIHGDSFFRINADSTIQLVLERQLTFPPNSANGIEYIYPAPRPRSSSVFPEGVYQSLTFKIVRAGAVPDTVPDYNPDDVFTDGGNYSLVINGTFNGNDFTYKAARNFIYEFEFIPPVSVTTEPLLYQFLISSNIESWFRNTGGQGFLNPAENQNDSLINANIDASFTIEQLSPE